jgi:hypothetical protein
VVSKPQIDLESLPPAEYQALDEVLKPLILTPTRKKWILINQITVEACDGLYSLYRKDA